jgi:hypothetical protein
VSAADHHRTIEAVRRIESAGVIAGLAILRSPAIRPGDWKFPPPILGVAFVF